MARKTALLTEKDREWLTGETSYGDEDSDRQRRYQRRESIVGGLSRSLRDFSLLVEHMDDDEGLADRLEELFDIDIEGASEHSAEEQELIDGLRSMLVFAFLASTDSLEFGDWFPGDEHPAGALGKGDHQSPGFLVLLDDALKQAYLEYDVLLEGISLHTETSRVPGIEGIRRKLAEGEELHPRVAALLLRSGTIDTESFSEFAREELTDDTTR